MRPERFTLASAAGPAVCETARAVRALSSAPPDVSATVAQIVDDVRDRGDAAVVELTRRFDSESAPERLRVPAQAIGSALDALEPGLRTALEVAVENVRTVAAAEPTADVGVDLPQGQRVELREIAVRRAGAYVPGGRAAYPSSALMCCVPAGVAGVEEVVVATPPGPGGEPSATVLAVCALCGIEEVYAIGGAQAIAALALGTDSVPSVDVIVGPGNHYVQEAKRQLAGVVGIDGIAGPSELVVIADSSADPALAALDLAAQAEHGSDSLLALFSPDPDLLDAAEAAARGLSSRHETVSDAPLALVRVPDARAAVALADAVAPEHLEIVCEGAEALAASVRSSGCVFVGAGGGTAFGDYAAGSNHVLPTGGAARFAGPLGAGRFRRRQALVRLPERATRALAPVVGAVARAEGFPVHAESAEARDGAVTRKVE